MSDLSCAYAIHSGVGGAPRRASANLATKMGLAGIKVRNVRRSIEKLHGSLRLRSHSRKTNAHANWASSKVKMNRLERVGTLGFVPRILVLNGVLDTQLSCVLCQIWCLEEIAKIWTRSFAVLQTTMWKPKKNAASMEEAVTSIEAAVACNLSTSPSRLVLQFMQMKDTQTLIILPAGRLW